MHWVSGPDFKLNKKQVTKYDLLAPLVLTLCTKHIFWIKDETEEECYDFNNISIKDICGYIGPTLVCTPITDTQESYLDVNNFFLLRKQLYKKQAESLVTDWVNEWVIFSLVSQSVTLNNIIQDVIMMS